MDLHDDPGIRSNRNLDRNIVTILVLCIRHIEDRKNGGGNDENCSFDKVTSRADPLANPEHQREYRIVSDSPIFVEKTFRLEFVGLWVCLWVMKNCPETSHSDKQSDG
jgi:hypothetical protein